VIAKATAIPLKRQTALPPSIPFRSFLSADLSFFFKESPLPILILLYGAFLKNML